MPISSFSTFSWLKYPPNLGTALKILGFLVQIVCLPILMDVLCADICFFLVFLSDLTTAEDVYRAEKRSSFDTCEISIPLNYDYFFKQRELITIMGTLTTFLVMQSAALYECIPANEHQKHNLSLNSSCVE